MSAFLTRISARSKEVLNSFGEGERTTLGVLIRKIESAGGMGFQILREHPEIYKASLTKTLNLGQIVEEAFFGAIRMGHTYVGTEHLLLASLVKAGYRDVDLISNEVEKVNSLPALLKTTKNSSKIVYLNTYGVDLTKKYIFYPKEMFVERGETDKMFTILLQKHDPNILLVGDEGSGKELLIEALARKVSYLDVPSYFVGTYVVDFNFQGFISAFSSSADAFDNALKSLATEVKILGGCVLVIKQLPNMVIPPVFRNFVETLNNAGAKIVVCCTDAEAGSEDLFYGFSVIEVEEPSQKITMEILRLEAKRLQNHFFTKIPPDIIKYAYEKAKSNIKDQVFPQKAISLLDKACSTASFEETKVPKFVKILMERHVNLGLQIEQAFLEKDYDKAVKVTKSIRKLEQKIGKIAQSGGVRLREVNKTDVDKVLEEYRADENREYKVGTKILFDLEKRLKQKIVGQDKAVEAVAKALVRSQMGLRPRHKPVGNFLFLGPTGVGKTELAKVLAQEAFGDNSLIRLDMSDFSEKHTVARLVGAPPGYIGYNDGGELTSKISRRPQSVVLFDEVEKAHPEVLNMLLQIMEEGQLSDMRGEVYSFSSAVIILTSNLGTDTIHKRDIGYGGGKKSPKEIEARIVQSVKSFLKPELLNRFDEVVTFRQLEKDDSKKILDILLKEVYSSLKEKGIKLSVDVRVKDFLLEKGFSVEFGARALRRTVEKELLDKVAGFLLNEKAQGRSEKRVVKETGRVLQQVHARVKNNTVEILYGKS